MRFRIDDIGRVRSNLATGGAFDAIRTTTVVQLRMTHGVGSRETKVEYAAMLLGATGNAGADIHRVVLEQELKRKYQEWLQEPNRGRPDGDGRSDRDAREIEAWADEHDLRTSTSRSACRLLRAVP